MKQLQIGVTSPLLRNQKPTADMGVTRHCAILKRLGATPIILHNDDSPSEILATGVLSGLIFSGGGDIAAGSYGGDASFAREVDLRRDIFESALMEHALRIGIPILAICRGMQLVNVLFDGTLIEDLPHHMGSAYTVMHDQVTECGLPYHAYVHDIAIVRGTLLHAVAGTECLSVNSIHHQAIRTLAPGLRAVAHATDGVIEAIEFAERYSGFFLGVQWHPEWLRDDPVSQCLYQRLIEACETRPTSRPSKDGGFRDVKQTR